MSQIELKCNESQISLYNSDLNEIIESLKIHLCYKYKNGFETKETSNVLRKLESVMYEMLQNNSDILDKKYCLTLKVMGY